jgi:hypothetical protein
MAARTKSILTIASTLVLGMVLGGLITGAAIGKRARTLAGAFLDKDRFVNVAERLIEPSAQQKDSLHALLQHYGAKIAENTRSMQRTQMLLFDSLRNDAMPLLTPEQQKRVRAEFERFDKRRAMLFPESAKGMKP